jgi:hypothetical protein
MFRASTADHQEVTCMYVANGTSKMTVSDPGWKNVRCMYVANGTSKMTVSEPGWKDVRCMYVCGKWYF